MTEKKRIPFDLARALAGDKFYAGDLKDEVTDFHYFRNTQDDETYPLKVQVYGELRDYTERGKYIFGSEDPKYDLYMAPKVKTYWANVYRYNGDMTVGGIAHKTEEEAKDAVYISERQDHIKTISFELTEEE